MCAKETGTQNAGLSSKRVCLFETSQSGGRVLPSAACTCALSGACSSAGRERFFNWLRSLSDTAAVDGYGTAQRCRVVLATHPASQHISTDTPTIPKLHVSLSSPCIQTSRFSPTSRLKTHPHPAYPHLRNQNPSFSASASHPVLFVRIRTTCLALG